MSRVFVMRFEHPEDVSFAETIQDLAIRQGATVQDIQSLVLHTGTLVVTYAMFEPFLEDGAELPQGLADDIANDVPEPVRLAQELIEVATQVIARAKEMTA